MVIKGNPVRTLRVIIVFAIFCISSLFLAFYLRVNHINDLLSYLLIAAFVLGVIFLSAFAQRSREGFIRLSPSGITLLVGLRPILMQWEEIDKIEVSELKGRPILGLALKKLDSQRVTIQNIALLNRENTGYHFTFYGDSLDKPLAELKTALDTYLQDESARNSLPTYEDAR